MPGDTHDGIGAVTGGTTAALPPAEQGVSVRLETEGGQPLHEVTKDQSFVVTVDKPRPAAGTPPETITITFTPPDGSTHTLTLKWDGGIKGPVRYRSEAVTVAHGAEGSASITLPSPFRAPGSSPEQGLEFRIGGMSGAGLPVLGLDVPNGGTLKVSVGTGPGAASTSLSVYDTVRKMVIAFNDKFFQKAYGDVIAAIQKLKTMGDSPAVTAALKTLQHKYDLLELARIDLANPKNTDIDLAIYGSTWVQLICRPAWETATFSDRWNNGLRAAAESSALEKERALWEFVRDVTIGYYQLVMSQIPLSGSLWTVLFGTDILGTKVDGWERLVAAFDLAGQGAVIALPIAVSAETNVRPTVSDRAPGATIVRAAEGDITRAPSGTRVDWPEDFGLEGRQAQTINLAVEKHAALIAEQEGIPFRKVYVLVRRTGTEALGKAAEGHAFKAELLKSKTNNATDLTGGWATLDGAVSYYTPDRVAAPFGVSADEIIRAVPDPQKPGQVRWMQPDPPGGVDPKVWKRAGQRIREYADEKAMMDVLIERGLVEVREDGVVIDRGVSNYSLDPHTHDSIKVFDGPEGGTGKPIYGDPDIYGFFFEDGTPLTVDQIAPIIKDLGPKWVQTPDGWQAEGARVMHPDIFSWDPHEQKNIDIKAAIMGAHEGDLYGWKQTPEGLVPVSGPSGDGTEALILLGGVAEPPKVAYGGVPLPPKVVKGRDFGMSYADGYDSGHRFGWKARIATVPVRRWVVFGTVVAVIVFAGVGYGAFGTGTKNALPATVAPAATAQSSGIGGQVGGLTNAACASLAAEDLTFTGLPGASGPVHVTQDCGVRLGQGITRCRIALGASDGRLRNPSLWDEGIGFDVGPNHYDVFFQASWYDLAPYVITVPGRGYFADPNQPAQPRGGQAEIKMYGGPSGGNLTTFSWIADTGTITFNTESDPLHTTGGGTVDMQMKVGAGVAPIRVSGTWHAQQPCSET